MSTMGPGDIRNLMDGNQLAPIGQPLTRASRALHRENELPWFRQSYYERGEVVHVDIPISLRFSLQLFRSKHF